jgi:hypothetical protein
MRQVLRCSIFTLGSALVFASLASASTVYTSDPSLNDFTSGITYGTFIAAPFGDLGGTVPYTPTTVTVDEGLRVYGGDSTDPLIVEFSSAVSSIRVFPNIDHFGANYDGYQYTILGSNDGVTFTPLFDALTVTGGGEPFTLGTFAGTAPLTVNNVLTPGGPGPSGGTVGYIADFTFSQAYKFYEFGATTIATAEGNTDQELTAVGTPTVPEPGSVVLVGTSLLLLCAGLRSRRRKPTL